jgi:hypothetical protein
LKRGKEAIDVLTEKKERNPDWLVAEFWLGKLSSAQAGGNWIARKSLMTFLKRVDPMLQSEAAENPEKMEPSLNSLKSMKLEAEALLTQVNKALQ